MDILTLVVLSISDDDSRAFEEVRASPQSDDVGGLRWT